MGLSMRLRSVRASIVEVMGQWLWMRSKPSPSRRAMTSASKGRPAR